MLIIGVRLDSPEKLFMQNDSQQSVWNLEHDTVLLPTDVPYDVPVGTDSAVTVGAENSAPISDRSPKV